MGHGLARLGSSEGSKDGSELGSWDSKAPEPGSTRRLNLVSTGQRIVVFGAKVRRIMRDLFFSELVSSVGEALRTVKVLEDWDGPLLGSTVGFSNPRGEEARLHERLGSSDGSENGSKLGSSYYGKHWGLKIYS